MTIDIESLGFSQEELQDRVIQRVADQVMEGVSLHDDLDDEGNIRSPSSFAARIEAIVQERIDATIADIAEKHLLPNVSEYIEKFTIQRTNEWGEAKGEPKTFTEYLVERAENYIVEPVDYNGKTKGESGGFSFHANQTRIVHLIDKHLQYHISVAVGNALKDLNSRLSQGIADTVKAQLAKALQKLKVEAKV